MTVIPEDEDEAVREPHGSGGLTDRADNTLTCDSPFAVVAALADADVRAILKTATGEPQTVSELVEACDIPESTVYRKVNRLNEIGLLEERTRTQTHGRHPSEYVTPVAAVTISISEREGLDVTSLREPADRAKTRRVTDEQAPGVSEVLTDGGENSRTDADARHDRLRALFTGITGTDELVEEQQRTDSSRAIDDATTSLSESVTAAMTDDGLTDAIDGLEREDRSD